MHTRNIFKNIISFLLVLAAIVSGVMVFFVTRGRLAAAANSYNLMLAADVLIVVYALIDLICGLIALARRVPRKVVRVRPFIQIAVIMAVTALFISAVNGIFIDHLVILGVCGILIPELFFLLLSLIMAR